MSQEKEIDLSKFGSEEIDLASESKLTDNSPHPLKGKYYGMRMGDLPASYLDWLRELPWIKLGFPKVYKYIEENWSAIEKELSDEIDDWEDTHGDR